MGPLMEDEQVFIVKGLRHDGGVSIPNLRKIIEDGLRLKTIMGDKDKPEGILQKVRNFAKNYTKTAEEEEAA